MKNVNDLLSGLALVVNVWRRHCLQWHVVVVVFVVAQGRAAHSGQRRYFYSRRSFHSTTPSYLITLTFLGE